jgi:hypothetical protein
MATNRPEPYARAMAWREMTEHELAGLPEARLGGALLWMVTAAAILCIGALIASLVSFQALREVGGRYTIAVAFIAVWSAVFVIMTLLRRRATPVVASVGFIAWIAYRFAVAMLSHAGWPLLVDLLGEAVLAAGFCGYMAGGVRPNAYYRRRLAAP